MTDILFSPIRLNELELLIENSVSKVLKNYDVNGHTPDHLLPFKEAAAFLNLSIDELTTLVSSKEILPAQTTGRIVKYSTKQLTEWKNKKGGASGK